MMGQQRSRRSLLHRSSATDERRRALDNEAGQGSFLGWLNTVLSGYPNSDDMLAGRHCHVRLQDDPHDRASLDRATTSSCWPCSFTILNASSSMAIKLSGLSEVLDNEHGRNKNPCCAECREGCVKDQEGERTKWGNWSQSDSHHRPRLPGSLPCSPRPLRPLALFSLAIFGHELSPLVHWSTGPLVVSTA